MSEQDKNHTKENNIANKNGDGEKNNLELNNLSDSESDSPYMILPDVKPSDQVLIIEDTNNILISDVDGDNKASNDEKSTNQNNNNDNNNGNDNGNDNGNQDGKNSPSHCCILL